MTDLNVLFSDTSTDVDGTVVSRLWNFGDGNSATTQNPSHSYASAGIYTVSLTVTDNNDASSSTSQSITVTAPAN
ncbi:PKD domain-containing protein, partial [Colwelliaceae bacterium BS250]